MTGSDFKSSLQEPSQQEFSQQEFSQQEFLRYARHLQLPNVGVDGQLSLRASHVTIVGCGGLGAPTSIYLAAAGVGKITLIDHDQVEISNLQRQITFSEEQIGVNKALATQQRLQSLNSDIKIFTAEEKLNQSNAKKLLHGSDLVLDCSDNFEARYAINDCCKAIGVPWIYASIFQFSGQSALFSPKGPCYRCLFPSASADSQDCSQAGVLGVLPGILGTMQSLKALEYLLNLQRVDDNCTELLMIETLPLSMRNIKINQDPQCITCHPSCDASSQHSGAQAPPSQQKLANTEQSAAAARTVEAACLHDWIVAEKVTLIDVRSATEHQAFNIGGANIPLDSLADSLANSEQATENPIVFYCQVGKRSQQAANLYASFTDASDVYSLAGGLNEYLKKHTV